MPAFFPPVLAAATPAADLTGSVSMWPLAVLGIGLAVIILLISVLRVHAFVALIFVAILTGILAGPLSPKEQARIAKDGIKLKSESYAARAVELAVQG